MLPFLIITSVLAQAEEPERIILRSAPPPAEGPRINGLRLGICAGFSTECYLAGLKLEYAWRPVAINVNMPPGQFWGGASLKIYPFDIREGERQSWRPYAYGGVAGVTNRFKGLAGEVVEDIFSGLGGAGAGVGVDVYMGENHAVIFQPSIGILYGEWPVPGVAMSLMYAN